MSGRCVDPDARNGLCLWQRKCLTSETAMKCAWGSWLACGFGAWMRRSRVAVDDPRHRHVRISVLEGIKKTMSCAESPARYAEVLDGVANHRERSSSPGQDMSP